MERLDVSFPKNYCKLSQDATALIFARWLSFNPQSTQYTYKPLCRSSYTRGQARICCVLFPQFFHRNTLHKTLDTSQGSIQNDVSNFLFKFLRSFLEKATPSLYYLKLSSIATATATVIPTMGLLPAPIKPIISTCAGTEEEPANCASECMRPMVSVIP